MINCGWNNNVAEQIVARSHGESFCVSQYAFLSLKIPVAADLHCMNHQELQFQLNIFFTDLLKKKKPSISWLI